MVNEGTPEDSGSDTNGRERLIEAAIDLFGRDGFDATSLRAVAEEAGVSWGLVRFHFGSKEGLREAAEERVIAEYLDLVAVSADILDTRELSRLIEEKAARLPLVTRFLRRAIIEERPVAFEFVKRLIASSGSVEKQLYHEFPSESWIADPMRNVASRLGYLVLAPLFLSLLGRDVFSIEELKLRNRQVLRTNELIRKGLEIERAESRAKRRR